MSGQLKKWVGMEIRVPLTTVTGITIKVKVPGQDKQVIAVIECDIPLPPDTTEGSPTIDVHVGTTEGWVEACSEKSYPQPKCSEGKFKPLSAIAIWYQEKSEKRKEVENGTKRTFRETFDTESQKINAG